MADRHQFRADWHDYNDGIYFVTVCCAGKTHLFGSIFNEEMRYSVLGKIALEYLGSIPTHHQTAEILNYVVMPNHIHLVISIAPPPRIWQRLFHEHVIRDRHSFDNIMNYIDNNVANWSLDCFNTAPAQRY